MLNETFSVIFKHRAYSVFTTFFNNYQFSVCHFLLQMMRSQVQGQSNGPGSVVSNTRTSKTGWLQDSFHPAITSLNRRVSDITGLNTDTFQDESELLQVRMMLLLRTYCTNKMHFFFFFWPFNLSSMHSDRTTSNQCIMHNQFSAGGPT